MGEVYGLRQWFASRASAFRSTYSLPANTSRFTRSVHLCGHFSSRWKLRENEAVCRASKSFQHRIHISPDYPPHEFMAGLTRASRLPDLYLIDIALKWAEKLIRRDGIEPRDVNRVEINGGRAGGTIIAVANTVLNELLVTYTDLGDFVHDGDGRFVARRNRQVSSRYYKDDFDDFPTTRNNVIEYTINYTANSMCESISQPSCTCGFYAYNNEDSLIRNSYTNDSAVFGLIKGYGKVTIGTKGFRAEKADIVALTQPVGFRVRGSDYPLGMDWYHLSRANELGEIMEDALEDSGVRLFKTPDQLLAFARVHLGKD